MSHDHSLDARKMGPNIHNVIKSGVEMFPVRNLKIGARTVSMLQSQMISPDVVALQHKTNSDHRIATVGGLSSGTWLAGGYDQFQINSSRTMLKRVFIKMTISNASGGNVVYLPVQLFQDISIFVNNESTLVQQIQGFDLWVSQNLHRNTENMSMLAAAENTTAAWAAAALLATGGTRTLYFEVPGFWRAGGFYLGHISKIIIRLNYYAAATYAIVSGTAAGNSISGLELITKTQDLSVEEAVELENKVPASGLAFRFLNSVYHRDNITLAASTSYDIRLTGIRGLAINMFVAGRASIASASSGAITPTDVLFSYMLCGEDGRSLTNGHYKEVSFQRYIDAAQNYDSAFLATVPVYVEEWAGSDEAFFSSGGKSLGYQPLNNNILKIVTSSTASGSYTLDIWAHVLGTLLVFPSKNVEVIRS